MKCPKCGKEGMKYLNRKKEFFTQGKKKKEKLVTVDKIAKCKFCDYEGIV